MHGLISLATALLLPPHTISLAASTHYHPCHCLVISALPLPRHNSINTSISAFQPRRHFALSPLPPLCFITLTATALYHHRRRFDYHPRHRLTLSPSPPLYLISLATASTALCINNLAVNSTYHPCRRFVSPALPLITLIGALPCQPYNCLTLVALPPPCLVSLAAPLPYQPRQQPTFSVSPSLYALIANLKCEEEIV